jgi:hypothetical protein
MLAKGDFFTVIASQILQNHPPLNKITAAARFFAPDC